MKVVLILSGGLDSGTLLYRLKDQGHEVYALTFNYGQKHKKEISYAHLQCLMTNTPHKIVNMENLKDIMKSSLTSDEEIPEGDYKEDNMKSTVVPNRNMVMISIAVSYALGIDAKAVYYGAHAGDHTIYPDCRPEFVAKLNEAIKICDWKDIRLIVPFLRWNKTWIVKEGIKLGIDYSNTWTCYKGGALACGKCGSCIERLEAFKIAGVEDPIKYEN